MMTGEEFGLLRRELKQVQNTLLPRLTACLDTSFPPPSLKGVKKYLLTEWVSAYPIRGLLATVAHRGAGGRFRAVVDIAAAIELAQLASLVVDDVIDRSKVRGGPSAYGLFGQSACILISEVVKSAASSLFARTVERNTRLVNGLTALWRFESMYKDVSLGQLMDLRYERHRTISETEYMDMINLTTAGFLEGAAVVGATLAGAPSVLLNIFRRYARWLGIAFQIYDDVLDLIPQEVRVKPFGNDLKRRKQRLPLLRYLHICPRSELRTATRVLHKREVTNRDVRYLTQVISESGALEYAVKRGKEFSGRARSEAMLLPSGSFRQLLLAMVAFIQPENDESIGSRSRSWLASMADY